MRSVRGRSSRASSRSMASSFFRRVCRVSRVLRRPAHMSRVLANCLSQSRSQASACARSCRARSAAPAWSRSAECSRRSSPLQRASSPGVVGAVGVPYSSRITERADAVVTNTAMHQNAAMPMRRPMRAAPVSWRLGPVMAVGAGGGWCGLSRDELVAETVHREDVLGLVWTGLELLSQLDHEVVHGPVGGV